MFSEISGRYDIGNDILSFGIHRLWKQRMVAQANPPIGGRVLDLATGTGDIALLFADAVGPTGHVIGSDFCAPMIAIAAARAKNRRPNLSFEVGDAMDLAYADDSFDICSISFGIRNVDDPEKALGEMRRVVRPGGRVVVLEFGQPSGLFGSLYRLYSNTLLPLAGGIVSGNFKAYDYLNKTAASFPCGEAFVAIMRRAGFATVTVEPLFGGVAWLYIGSVEAPDPMQQASAEGVREAMERSQ
jgi:demethylmenaquinone methyltransferase/2-methoxy-6-polyprenyl-1,4-benzoquinol methylase